MFSSQTCFSLAQLLLYILHSFLFLMFSSLACFNWTLAQYEGHCSLQPSQGVTVLHFSHFRALTTSLLLSVTSRLFFLSPP